MGEDYHESKLEEPHIFPIVKKTGGPDAAYINTLVGQHFRGREITDYVLAVTRSGKVKLGDAEPLARVLSSFVWMYQNHAAREDAIVFPAWKTAMSSRQIDELGEKFEDIEKQQFGSDSFDKAVAAAASLRPVAIHGK